MVDNQSSIVIAGLYWTTVCEEELGTVIVNWCSRHSEDQPGFWWGMQQLTTSLGFLLENARYL